MMFLKFICDIMVNLFDLMILLYSVSMNVWNRLKELIYIFLEG